jgi:hypothetical protein
VSTSTPAPQGPDPGTARLLAEHGFARTGAVPAGTYAAGDRGRATAEDGFLTVRARGENSQATAWEAVFSPGAPEQAVAAALAAAGTARAPRMEQADRTATSALDVTVYRYGPHTVRVRVHRDFYPHQSSAAAELLSGAGTWTVLAVDPAENWHPRRLPLPEVAAGLRDRQPPAKDPGPGPGPGAGPEP